MEPKTTAWSEFPTGGKATKQQMLGSEEINKSKRAELWVSGKLTRKVNYLSNRKVNYLSKFIWDIKILPVLPE